MTTETTTHAIASLSTKPERRFWGWGYLWDGVTDDEKRKVDALFAWLVGGGPSATEPPVDDFDPRNPRSAFFAQ